MIRKANKAVFGQYLKNVVDCTVTSSNPSSPLIIDGHGWLLYQITSFTGFETYGDKLSPYVSCVFIQVKMGPLADRVGVSNMQLTALTAGLIKPLWRRRGQHLPEQVHYEEESSYSKGDGCCKGEGELLLQERADKL